MNPAACIVIYARYSSDLQNPSSVDDQVALCRQFIKDQFKDDLRRILVYSDAAISGSTITRRPGMTALRATVTAGRVSLVVAEGLDRLSRSMKDIAEIHEILGYRGVTIWTVLEGRITELHVGLKGTMNALFLRDMKEKVRRGQKARVLAGFSSSSCAYGYRVVRGVVDERGRNVNGVREINLEQAAVIRRVYEDYAAGKTLLEIVTALNAENIPSPSGGLWKRNALMGGVKKQEGLLRNEIYRGMLVFNRSYVVRDPTTGRKRQVPLLEDKWTRVEAPDLRIIDDNLWRKVREIDRPRPQTTPETKKPRLLSSHNQHALTGWIKCGWCGGSKSLASDTRYVCSTWRYARQCKNSRGTKEPFFAGFRLCRLGRAHQERGGLPP